MMLSIQIRSRLIACWVQCDRLILQSSKHPKVHKSLGVSDWHQAVKHLPKDAARPFGP